MLILLGSQCTAIHIFWIRIWRGSIWCVISGVISYDNKTTLKRIVITMATGILFRHILHSGEGIDFLRIQCTACLELWNSWRAETFRFDALRCMMWALWCIAVSMVDISWLSCRGFLLLCDQTGGLESHGDDFLLKRHRISFCRQGYNTISVMCFWAYAFAFCIIVVASCWLNDMRFPD